MGVGDLALGVDQVRLRDAFTVIGLSEDSIAMHQNGVRQFELFHEFLDRGAVPIVDIDRNDAQLGAVRFLQRFEVRSLRTARWSPGREVIQQDRGTCELRQADFPAGEVFQGEVRSRGAHPQTGRATTLEGD